MSSVSGYVFNSFGLYNITKTAEHEMDVIERIEQLRNERGWSVNYLAMEAMITQSTLNNIFCRHSEPKLSTLRAICDAFGITLSEFFSEDASSSDDELVRRIRALPQEQKDALLTLLRAIK